MAAGEILFNSYWYRADIVVCNLMGKEFNSHYASTQVHKWVPVYL